MARNSELTFLFIHKVVCLREILTKHHDDILCLADCPVDWVSWNSVYHYDTKSSHVPSCSTLHQGKPDTSAFSDQKSVRPRRTVHWSVSWHAVKITYPFYMNILIPLKFLFPEDNNGWRLKIQTFWNVTPCRPTSERRFDVIASLWNFDKAKHIKDFNPQYNAARIPNLAWIVITFTDT